MAPSIKLRNTGSFIYFVFIYMFLFFILSFNLDSLGSASGRGNESRHSSLSPVVQDLHKLSFDGFTKARQIQVPNSVKTLNEEAVAVGSPFRIEVWQ